MRRAAAGVALGQAIWTLAASAGLVALLSASEPVFHALRLAGAAYLAYLGARSLGRACVRRARAELTPDTRAATEHGLRQGVLSNIGNPKMAARNLIAGRVRRALDGLTGLVLLALGLRLAAEPG